MMNWDWFIYFAVLSVVLWTAGSWNAFKGSQSKACVFMVVGLLVFGTFIGLLWESLERPPLRTMGETRLWYSFFLPLAGLITYVTLVLFLFAIGRTDNLCQMEIQMDSVFQYHTVGGIHLRQPAQA